jgi:hypothetical protein
MNSSVAESELEVEATAVTVTDEALTVELEDGRTISVPLQWFPRLRHGTPQERANFEIGAFGVHWPDLDEDISVRGLILGRRSGEGPGSLKFWLDNRKKGRKVTFEDYMKSRRQKPRSKSRK